MKTRLLLVCCCLCTITTHAQKVDVSIQANSGLFNFSGSETQSSSYILKYYQANGSSGNYTTNLYGNRVAFSYGIALQTQYVAKSGFIAGLQGGYDILRSKTNVTAVQSDQIIYTFNILTPYPGVSPAAGSAYFQNQFINLNPYFGYRFHIKKVSLDVVGGTDIGINTGSYDKAKAISENEIYTVDLKKPNAPTDWRAKLALVAYYNKFGVDVSYAYGFTNYDTQGGSNPLEAHSRLLRFGVSYRIY